MESLKKNTIIIVLFIILLGITISVINNKRENLEVKKDLKQIKIAICPTYQYLKEEINNYGYEVVKTKSTAQSINLLRKGEVNIVLSGRKPMPNESDLAYKIILLPNRYSFLSKNSKTVFSEELKSLVVYTDQDTQAIKTIFNIDNVKKVENVYMFLDKGIVITSWDNTDYKKASVVHILENNKNRHQNSRIPIIYSKDEKLLDQIYKSLNNLINKKVLI